MLLGPRPGHVHQLLWAVIWGPGMRPSLPAPSHVLAPDWDFLALLKTGSCSWGCLEKREAFFLFSWGLGEKRAVIGVGSRSGLRACCPAPPQPLAAFFSGPQAGPRLVGHQETTENQVCPPASLESSQG